LRVKVEAKHLQIARIGTHPWIARITRIDVSIADISLAHRRIGASAHRRIGASA
jgi:hypothetical protein